MQKGIIPRRTWLSPDGSAAGGSQPPPPADNSSNISAEDGIRRRAKKLVSESAVIVFGLKGCYMCHVVRLLLVGLGVNPPIVEVEEADVAGVIDELSADVEGKVQFPAVFVGGKLFGGVERVVATLVSGDLVPMLRQAGALWL